MSLVSFLGGYSALLILGDEDNIDLDIDFEGDPVLNATDFEINIEFEIYNKGYFDLEDLKIEMRLNIVYDYVNYTGDGRNVTRNIKIYEDEESFSTIEAGHKEKKSITIEPDDLLKFNFTEILPHIDQTRDPPIEFVAGEIVITAKYSLGLISFKVKIEDYSLGELE